MSRLIFNPLTGQLDQIDSSFWHKKYVTVDSGFLSPRKVTLTTIPRVDSELVFFNGLIIKEDCYTISNAELTFDALLDIRIGDEIDIRYVA